MSFVGISEYQIHRSDRDHDPAFSAPKFDASAPDTRFLTNLPHKLLGKVYVKDIAFNLAAFGEVVPSHQVIETAVDDMSNFTLSHLFSGRLRWQCHTANRGVAQLSNHHADTLWLQYRIGCGRSAQQRPNWFLLAEVSLCR